MAAAWSGRGKVEAQMHSFMFYWRMLKFHLIISKINKRKKVAQPKRTSDVPLLRLPLIEA